MRIATTAAAAAILIALAPSCQPADDSARPVEAPATQTTPAATPAASPAAPIVAKSGATTGFAAITADETIRLVGTEPFWGGTARAGEMVYTTPENQTGETIAVRRFAGNNGLGFSGTRNGAPFDLTVTPGKCSDGMSDRTYPFTATLKLADEQRNGCAWTDRMRFTGSENP